MYVYIYTFVHVYSYIICICMSLYTEMVPYVFGLLKSSQLPQARFLGQANIFLGFVEMC